MAAKEEIIETGSTESLTCLPRVALDNKYPIFTHETESEWKDNFIFIQAADTQFGLIDNWAGNPVKTRTWTEEIRLTRQAIKHANEMTPRPRFFIVCGDLVDDMPEGEHRLAQEKDFKRIFDELDSDIPLVCVCGNHDVGNAPTKETLKKYRSRYGDDFFTFWVGGVLFIVLNSQFYADHSNVPEEYERQEKWLDEQLAISKSKECSHCIIFQHIPWFLKEPDEQDDYFNIEKSTRLRMLKKFKDAGVKHIFSGHYHRNAGGFDDNLEMVVTSAIGCQIGNDKSGMRLVRVSEHQIDHKYYSLEDFPNKVDLNVSALLP